MYLGSCYYEDSLKKFVWSASEITKPYDKFTKKQTVSQYMLDARDGHIIKIEKNIVINYMFKGHWFWDEFVKDDQRFPIGTLLDSILLIDSVSKIQVTYNGKKISLNKNQLYDFKLALKKCKSLGGLFINLNPYQFKINLYYNESILNKKQQIYITRGKIHFQYAIDKWGIQFQNSFNFPDSFDTNKLISNMHIKE